MGKESDLRHAKFMRNVCLAFVIFIFLMMVTAITFHCHWSTVISGVIAGGMATHAYQHWRKKYNELNK